MSGIAVLDAGGQYCHLIARRVRELHVKADIFPVDVGTEEIREYKGIIISGSPRSVYEEDAPVLTDDIICTGVPILGICYGMHMIVRRFGGAVVPGEKREYGVATITVAGESKLFWGTRSQQQVWMSHGDKVKRLPQEFEVLASTPDCPYAAFRCESLLLYGLQFHPEVSHTEYGKAILERFVFDICKADQNWSPNRIIDLLLDEIRSTVGKRKVYFLMSGGVDSTIAYALCAEALPKEQLEGVFIDTGLMRKGDTDHFNEVYHALGLPNVMTIGAQEIFVRPLEEVTDPEKKRKLIGQIFVVVCESLLASLNLKGDNWMLGQGTIYPDTIESGGTAGSSIIKTHHNQVESIQELKEKGRLLEPLKGLYKDEVREIGTYLQIPRDILNRHPFPGPGLAIRTIGSQSNAPATLCPPIEAIVGPKNYKHCVLPLHAVGVQGDKRTYGRVAVIAGGIMEVSILKDISTQVTNTCEDITRVLYCLTPYVNITELKVTQGGTTEWRLSLLRDADAIVTDILITAGIYNQYWQFPVILLPVGRESRPESIVLRPVLSVDGMTAEVPRMSPSILIRMRMDIQYALSTIDCVFLDITNKPPATIEWE